MIREFAEKQTKQLSQYIGKIARLFPLTPNQWSVLSAAPAVYGLFLVYSGEVGMGAVWFAVAGLADLIDGGLARLTGQTSDLGAYIDGVIDWFVDFLIVFSFFFLGLPTFFVPAKYWVAVQLYFALMPTFIVAYVNHREAVPDPTEKVVWRILHRAEMYPLFILVLIAAIFDVQWAMYILALTTTLSVATTVQSFVLGIKRNREYRDGDLDL